MGMYNETKDGEARGSRGHLHNYIPPKNMQIQRPIHARVCLCVRVWVHMLAQTKPSNHIASKKKGPESQETKAEVEEGTSQKTNSNDQEKSMAHTTLPTRFRPMSPDPSIMLVFISQAERWKSEFELYPIMVHTYFVQYPKINNC